MTDRRHFVAATLVGLCIGSRALAAADPVVVTVRLDGRKVSLDVEARPGPVTRDVVWGVLTDYDHMADFLSALTSSHIVRRDLGHLEVAQSGAASRGPFTFSFTTLRAVDVHAATGEIDSHLISGDFDSYDFSTRLTRATDGAWLIRHHGEYVPHRWVPPFVGPALIETEVRKQYEELIGEMQRRQQGATARPAR